ncbi:MAG: hypothetical protein E7E21_02655 [Peptostreptococcaceae bacterium]|nr:hypothetical protein [Peptostreptococcaceae bacterium]
MYWKHYIALEEKFLETTKYVEVSEDNFNTYSIEFSTQLQSICSEIDVVLKELCKVIDSNKNPKDINGYARIILSNNGDLKDIKVKVIINSGLELIPLNEWNINIDSAGNENIINPSWWRSYNKVKHQRTI